jgi:hypothetical protein
MPSPLSSQTSSSGMPIPCRALQQAAFTAPVAVEWFADASPKLATTTASSGQRSGRRSRAGMRSWRPSAQPMPRARGRWLAMVDVCGITARSGCPNTLCRPPATGSSVDAASPSATSSAPSPGVRPAQALRAR